MLTEFSGLLTLAIFLPIAGAIVIALFLNGTVARGFALATTLVELLITSYIFLLYDKEKGGYQLVEKFEGWIPFDTVSYTHLTLPTIYSV